MKDRNAKFQTHTRPTDGNFLNSLYEMLLLLGTFLGGQIQDRNKRHVLDLERYHGFPEEFSRITLSLWWYICFLSFLNNENDKIHEMRWSGDKIERWDNSCFIKTIPTAM